MFSLFILCLYSGSVFSILILRVRPWCSLWILMPLAITLSLKSAQLPSSKQGCTRQAWVNMNAIAK